MKKPEKKDRKDWHCQLAEDDNPITRDRGYNQACDDWEKYHNYWIDRITKDAIKLRQSLPSEKEIEKIIYDYLIGKIEPVEKEFGELAKKCNTATEAMLKSSNTIRARIRVVSIDLAKAIHDRIK